MCLKGQFTQTCMTFFLRTKLFWRILRSKQHLKISSLCSIEERQSCRFDMRVSKGRQFIFSCEYPFKSVVVFQMASVNGFWEEPLWGTSSSCREALPHFWYLQLQLKWTDDWQNTIYLPHHNRHHLTENLTYYLEIQSQFCLPTHTRRLSGCRDLCPAFLETQREICQSKQTWGLGIWIWKP